MDETLAIILFYISLCVTIQYSAVQYTGFAHLLESPEIFCEISRTWKVLENEFGPGKSWKSKCMVLESPGIC